MISSPYSQQPWHQVGPISSIVCEGIHSPPPVKHAARWQGTKNVENLRELGMIFHPACDCMGEFGGLSITSLVATIESVASPTKKKNSQHAKSGCPSFGGRRAFSSPSPSGPSQKHLWVKHISCSRSGNNHNHNDAYAYYASHYDYDTTTTRLPLGDYDYDYDCWVRGREEHYKVITLRSRNRSWWNSLPLKLRCQVFWHPLTTGKWTCIEDVNFSKMTEFSSSMANQRARSSYSC